MWLSFLFARKRMSDVYFFFQAEDGIRDYKVTGVQTCALPICFEVVRSQWRPSELFLLDRNGEVIHEQRVDPRRRRLEWVALADISPALRSAVLASEDRRFETHGGVDAHAIAAAGWQRA